MQNSRKSGAISCKFKERQCQPSILHFLTGKKFVRILKSLDIPCFSGKGKGKQIDTQKKNLSNVEAVNIKYPKKVCTIFNILHFLMHVVWLSLKHYRKIF